MRIIGGHDYYDSGLAYGQDESLIFLRNGDRRVHNDIEHIVGISTRRCNARFANKGEKPGRRYSYFYRHAHDEVSNRNYKHTFFAVHVIFCGKLYSGFHINRETKGWPYERKSFWAWNADAVRNYAEENDIEIDQGKNTSGKTWITENTGRNQVETTILSLEDWLTPVKLNGKALNYIISERITIAARKTWEPDRSDKMNWEVDRPSLSEIEFAKAVDPYTAFQEISMWIGGVIPHDGPAILEITDNRIKIEKHGFHHPTSFRKAKSK